jgi:hypothetical protein
MCSNFLFFYFSHGEKIEKGEGVSKNQTHPLDGPTPMGILFLEAHSRGKNILGKVPSNYTI